tara:strand:- start:138 stop:551 length:414 start_codon:yes stop_codon:yes gene_type:complete
MYKSIHSDYLLNLPSGNSVHPCRLIHRDGTLMWKHAFLYQNEIIALPEHESQEAHIIKTAARIEELNTWVSQNMEPWEALHPHHWFDPRINELKEGISCYFKHSSLNNDVVYKALKNHIADHELLELRDSLLFFRRC